MEWKISMQQYPRCSKCNKFGPDLTNNSSSGKTSAVNASKSSGISWTGGLMICPCERAFYCNVGCQEGHWQEHKYICGHGRKTEIPVTRCCNCGFLGSRNMWCACGTVLYCSLKCQREHWDNEHFEVCRPFEQSKEALSKAAESHAMNELLHQQQQHKQAWGDKGGGGLQLAGGFVNPGNGGPQKGGGGQQGGAGQQQQNLARKPSNGNMGRR